ncbi:MAG: M23 family metallopeptidase [Elusimicrobiota bacterium]|nr:M23 family metallopeptidase [Elusimicrobiota bacterium]
MGNIYTDYLYAVKKNQELVQQNVHYSQQVEETLNMLSNVKRIEAQLRGMLGMKSAKNIVEHYPTGGAFSEDSGMFLSGSDSINHRSRFESNVAEIKRESWQQNQSLNDIKGFINRKKDVLLSTPSIWPVFGYITSGYGWRTNPISRRRENHRAIDIYNMQGLRTPIRTTARGRVVLAGWAGSYGKLAIIDHGNGFSTRYAHLSRFTVEQGDKVEQGQIIGYIGSSGNSTGPHLHYEVWHQGKPVNPMQFVKGR